MAQKVQVALVDDLDGSEADETVRFGLDGKTYEIDLNADNAKALREGLGEWVAAARKAGAANTVRKAVTATGRNQKAAEIRAWASENGYELPARGRISAAVTEAYEKANG